jgi:tripartite tricarboxylate transporter TctB family protein
MTDQSDRQGIGMTLRRDHVAGAAFLLAGAIIWGLSGDLPFGTLASPGAGMLPKLVVSVMMAFGAILFARAGASPPIATIPWDDFPHALRVLVVTAAAVALYTRLGFLLTMGLLLFGLTCVIERKPILDAVLFSAGVTGITYLLFNTLLKSPLPRGVLWF